MALSKGEIVMRNQYRKIYRVVSHIHSSHNILISSIIDHGRSCPHQTRPLDARSTFQDTNETATLYSLTPRLAALRWITASLPMPA